MKKLFTWIPLVAIAAAMAQTAGAEPNGPEQQLIALRNGRAELTPPASMKTSKVTEISLEAPEPAKDFYSQAYKTADGCQFFGLPLKLAENLTAAWIGSKCGGGLVKGQGELRFQWREKTKSGAYQNVQSVLSGSFEKGFLSGRGTKKNFILDDSKSLLEVFAFAGEFQYGVLSGAGESRKYFRTDARPTAVAVQGQFKAGSPVGLVKVARLNPQDGVEADAGDLLLNEQGLVYTYQSYQNKGASLNWLVYFKGDDKPWQFTVVEWHEGDGSPGTGWGTGGKVSREGSGDKPGSNILVSGFCDKWAFNRGVLTCPKGSGWYAEISTKRIFSVQLKDKPFQLAVAGQVSIPLVVPRDADVLIYAGVANPDWSERYAQPMRCSENFAVCSGKQIVPISGTRAYWFGSATVTNGALSPDLGKGAFYGGQVSIKEERDVFEAGKTFKRQIVTMNPAKDERQAECVRFDRRHNCAVRCST